MNKDKVYLEGYVVGHAADTLGYKGLMVQLENLDVVEIDENLVHKEIEEPQLIKLKDIIARMEGLNGLTRIEWLDDILYKFGSNYGASKYKLGYEQGKLEGSMIPYEESQKVTIPQFVADWIEYCKITHVDLQHALIVGDVYFYNYANQKDFSKLKEFLETENNQETFARAWLDGYKVEKEKRYLVKMKGKIEENVLTYGNNIFRYFFTRESASEAVRIYHTRKELEDAGFGWVFDCEGIEIKEVEE